MDTQSSLVQVTDRPKVGDLIIEFRRNGSQGDQFGRMLRAEDTRLARWDGQSEDGKKHAADQPDGDEVFPWEGASDVRNYLADGAVNESVALCYMAFWNAVLKIAGANTDDLTASGTATEFLDWMIHFQLHRQLDNEVELAAQYMFSIGAVGLHVTWEREVGRKLKKVEFSDFQMMAQAVQQQMQAAMQQKQPIPPEAQQLLQVLQALPQLVLDPTLEAEAVKAVQYLFGEYVMKNLPEELSEQDVLQLSAKRARQCVKDLRATGECEFPMPYLVKNQPKISALKPYRDFVLPVEVGSIETAPVVFVRDLMTEADLRRMVLGAGWDADWVDEAVKTKGKFSTWQLNNPYSAYGTWSWRAVDNRSWLIEVVWAYYKQVDEDGVTQIVATVFSPHLTVNPKGGTAFTEYVNGKETVRLDDFAAKHEILNYPRAEYPVILGRRERFDRSWLATRGLPEILATDQNVEKAMLDSVVDLAGMAAVPPLLVPKGLSARFKIGPAVQNEYVPGREPKFMQMPGGGNAAPAETVVQTIRQRAARYCGLFDAQTPPQLTAMMQQPMVKKFLVMWGEALQMAFELTAKFAPEKIEKVTGNEVPQDADDFHYVMQFDATQFHPELMDAKLAAFDQLAQTDRTGTIDQAALTKFKASIIDPQMAKTLVIEQGQASVKLQKDVQSDVGNMFLGSEAIYGDASNDPAAQMKLQYAQQILQGNPNYLHGLDPKMVAEFMGPQAAQQIAMMQAQSGQQPNPRFTELVANYLKNLKQGTVQQQNKGVGRTGVKQLT
jgi:hypothetical protein